MPANYHPNAQLRASLSHCKAAKVGFSGKSSLAGPHVMESGNCKVFCTQEGPCDSIESVDIRDSVDMQNIYLYNTKIRENFKRTYR